MGKIFVISVLVIFILLVWAGELYQWIETFKSLKKYWRERILKNSP
jgi:hypothetical protein